MRIRGTFLVAILAAFGPLASAHHSASAEFDVTKRITVQGTLTKVDWINPHAFLTVQGKADNGKAETWKVELGSPGALTKTGWKRASVKTGDEVEIKGWYARDGKRIINAEGVKNTRTGLELDAKSSYHDTKAAN